MPLSNPRASSLWPIPLAAGLLMGIAGMTAFLLAVRLELIPACNPFWEGCVSISRAARYDLPNHIFRALVLPGAVLQALTWALCRPWLNGLGATSDAWLKALPLLGMIAGIFLVLYGTFLGTEGEAYRWMRRYGVIFYFGLTCICMVITAGHLFRLSRGGWLHLRLQFERVLIGSCFLLLGLGLASAFSPLYVPDPHLQDRVGNALEWNGATIFVLFFLALGWLWRATRFAARLSSER
jgi:hypothetical protein